MPDTGAPYSIPYLDGTELVRDYPQASEDLADAIVDALDGIPVLAGIGSNVVSVTKTDTFSTSSTSFTGVTGLSAAITPSTATSKVLVLVNLGFGVDEATVGIGRLVRASNAIYVGDAASNRIRASFTMRSSTTGAANVDPLDNIVWNTSLAFLDSPTSASAVTYEVEVLKAFGTNIYVNRSGRDANVASQSRTASSITLIEVAA
jgi:hypothetical protein